VGTRPAGTEHALLREQFLRDWVRRAPVTAGDLEQLQFLGMDTTGGRRMAVIHVVERMAAAPVRERGRTLALYAVRSGWRNPFADFSPRWIFMDDHDNRGLAPFTGRPLHGGGGRPYRMHASSRRSARPLIVAQGGRGGRPAWSDGGP